MNKLSIFWGDKSSEYFRWYLEPNHKKSNTDNEVNDLDNLKGLAIDSMPLLESHEILKADLAVLADIAAGKKVELILSSQDIHLNQVELPNQAQRHLSKAIPYLIEEALAESVDNLFIAAGNRNKEQKISVRGISRNYLDNIFQLFKVAEISLNAIYTDIDLLEKTDVGYSVLINQDALLINQENGAVWSCNIQDFSWLVQKELSELDDELPIAIPIKIISEDSERGIELENQLPVGRFAAEVLEVDSIEEWLLDFKNEKTKGEKINLLQGEFAIKSENSQLKKILTKVASVVAIVLFAHLFYQGSYWFTLNSEYNQLQEEKSSLWKQAFPGKKYDKNKADRILKGRLKEISGGQGDSAFLPMLSSVSDQIENLQQLYPTNISYDAVRNELRLDLVAKELGVLDVYKSQLKQNGYQVEGTSATQRGDGYSSRLIIRK